MWQCLSMSQPGHRAQARGARGQLSSVLWSALRAVTGCLPELSRCVQIRDQWRAERGESERTHEPASRASWSVSGWTRPTTSWASRPPRPRSPRQRHAFVTNWYRGLLCEPFSRRKAQLGIWVLISTSTRLWIPSRTRTGWARPGACSGPTRSWRTRARTPTSTSRWCVVSEIQGVTECDLQKHYEDKSKKKDYPPANDSATTHSVDVLTCPRPATPPPPPKPAPPPPVVMRKKKTPPPAPVEVFEGPRDVEGDNSKWSWMR